MCSPPEASTTNSQAQPKLVAVGAITAELSINAIWRCAAIAELESLVCRCAYIQPVGSRSTQPAPREICVITGCGGHSYSQTTNGADGVEVGPWPAFGRLGFPTALPRTGL